MEENVLTLDNNIETSKELVTEKEQNNFLETTFGQVINSAIDIGIRALLPNFLEDGIINVKNTLLKQGLAEGIQTVVKEGINLGKSVLGIFTGKFDDVGQMQTAIQKGGIIDSTSDLLDTILSKVQNMRKEKGFEVLDHITLYVAGNKEIESIIKENEEQIKHDTLATEVIYHQERDNYITTNINGENLDIDMKVVN